jgi:hypothetical protein
MNLEKSGNKVVEVKRIKMVPVNNIFEQYFPQVQVDLMSVDAEGVDLEIIRSMNFSKYTPKVICIETINYTPDGTGTKRHSLCELIENAGYFEYANTNINSIFINKAWWYNG